jgi:hypothetical protein
VSLTRCIGSLLIWHFQHAAEALYQDIENLELHVSDISIILDTDADIH